MIRFKFIHNATGLLEIGGQRILLDPWLVEDKPPFFGAWGHWPRLPDDVIEQVGDCDVIWISHCHEDHYHLPSLRAYMKTWGAKPICSETMADRAAADGFALTDIPGSRTFVAKNGIDSALAVRYGSKSVVNLTDVHYDQEMIDAILNFCGHPTVALLPFAGAGPWPQTYYSDQETLAEKAKEKQAMFVERYLRFRDSLKANINVPFAGQYRLLGRLAYLNRWRGMNDAVDMPWPRVVLRELGELVVEDGEGTHAEWRDERHPEPPDGLFDYEADPAPNDAEVTALLNIAWERSPLEDVFIAVDWIEDYWYRGSSHSGRSMDIKIDARLLKRLLTGQAHWADADAGSHYTAGRNPDVYDKSVMDWLWDFHA